MPYFSYLTMLFFYETLGWWSGGAEVRKVHFAEVRMLSETYNTCITPFVHTGNSSEAAYRSLWFVYQADRDGLEIAAVATAVTLANDAIVSRARVHHLPWWGLSRGLSKRVHVSPQALLCFLLTGRLSLAWPPRMHTATSVRVSLGRMACRSITRCST